MVRTGGRKCSGFDVGWTSRSVPKKPSVGTDLEVHPTVFFGTDLKVHPTVLFGTDREVHPTVFFGTDREVHPTVLFGTDREVHPTQAGARSPTATA